MKSLLPIIFFTVLTSCDPGYAYLINNKSENNIYVFTNPPMKIYDKTSIAIEKESVMIKPQESFRIYSSIGFGGSEDSFPYDKILIMKEKDSIILKNKSEINTKFNKNIDKKGFSRTYNVYIN